VSKHSLKSKRRHPDAIRERFEVGLISLEYGDHREDGRTFALIAGQALEAKDRRPLFTGYVKKGMATQLRKLAHRFDEMEKRL